MTFEEFTASVQQDEPPPGIGEELRALWLSSKDRWNEAHEVVNDIPSPMGSWIHAHLHRIEGDLSNAAYWYARAAKPTRRDQAELDTEWAEIVRANL